MRDVHRMREKYDLSLDSRQVVSLLIGGIVVLGAVFVLGVLVGKKLAGTPRPDRSPDLLTALDHRSDALERARATPPLTFQEELTRPTPAPPTLARTPAPATPAPTTASSATVSPAASAAAPATKPAPTARAAAVPATTVAAADVKPAPERGAEPAEHEKKTDAEKKVEPASPRNAAAAEPVATRSTPAAAHPAPKIPDATSPTGAFTLQLGASLNRDDAERQASRLREKGYAPYIVTAEVPGKGTWYRVRMGSFPTKDAATRYLQDFKRETQAEAFVASTR